LFCFVRWKLKHPDTGEAFPADLPKDVFPAVHDAEVDLWHQSCAQKLRTEAASKSETPPAAFSAKPEPAPGAQSPKFTYVHVRKPDFQEPPVWRRHADPTAHAGRGYPHNNHPPGRYADNPRPADRSPERSRRDASPKTQARRRSFSDIPSPTSQEPPIHAFPSPYERNPRAAGDQRRRHSHPRRTSSDESSDEEPASRRPKRRSQVESPPPPSVRRFVPPSAPPPASSPPASFRPHRSEMRADDHKKRGVPSPRGSLRNKLSETVSNILPNGLMDRQRNGSPRRAAYNEPLRPRRSRDHFQPSRLSHTYSSEQSDESLGDESSEDELHRRRRSREERDRDRGRYRDAGRPRDPDRELDDERDTNNRRDRSYLQRPPIQRRTSSHADIDRRRDHPMWEPNNRDRIKEERRRFDRRSQEERERGPSPGSGPNGRRYHAEPAYT
jgi:hypothetical protein